MELRQLAAFVATAERGSFSAAADALGVVQPAISQAVRRLEDDLGVVLLERTSRRVALTADGEALLAHARAVVDAARTLEREARGLADGTTGVLRLATTAGSTRTVRALIEGLRERRPDAEVRLARANGSSKVAAVLAGELDAALVRSQATVRGLAHVEVAREAWQVVLAVGHPLATLSALTLADLEGWPFASISRGEPVAMHAELAQLAAQEGAPIERGPALATLDELLVTLGTTDAWSLLTPGAVTRADEAGVVARPLRSSLAPAATWLVHRTDPDPLLAELLGVARGLPLEE